jgi:hypothetical protein
MVPFVTVSFFGQVTFESSMPTSSAQRRCLRCAGRRSRDDAHDGTDAVV